MNVVQNVRSPFDHGNAGQIAPNEHAALVEFEIRGDPDDAADKVGPVLDAVDDLQKAHPGLFIGEFGDASKVDAVVTAYENDLGKAGLLSLPVTLLILVVAFGALVAAGIPLLLALTAVFATLGLIAIPSLVFPVAMQAPALVLLVGLAVGVDYSMFYLKREREERAAGRSEQAALEAAAATSGRSVLISGLTVIVAMAGMFLTGDPTFASLGVAAITVVAIAVLGSLTVLPALLSKLGDRVDRGRVPLVGRIGHAAAKAGSGARSSTASCVGRSSRPSSQAGCCWRWQRRLSSCAWRWRGRTRSRSRCPSCRPTSGCSRRSRAPRCRRTSSSRPRTSRHLR